jgi:hypothetical protein
MKKPTHTIVVFPDGETWNTVEGCSIITITDEEFQDLCADRIDASDTNPSREIDLKTVAETW